MAMSYVIRKTSPTVFPLALRAISNSSTRVVLPESDSYRSHQFSTAAVDQKLVKVLKSEIKSMEPKTQRPVTTPADFPFKIEDGYSSIKLTRELPEEEIKVCVEMPIVIGKEDYNDSSSDSDNDNNSSTNSSDDEEEEKYNANPSLVGVPLKVKIFKKDGTFMEIEVLGCAHVIIVKSVEIYVSSDSDRSLFRFHSAPKFKELARDVRYSIKEFLGVRGINKTNVEFLIKYMDRRPYDYTMYKREMHFLETFKKFVSRQAC